MGWLSWCIKDLWGTKVMSFYVVKWPVFSLQRGSSKWPIAISIVWIVWSTLYAYFCLHPSWSGMFWPKSNKRCQACCQQNYWGTCILILLSWKNFNFKSSKIQFLTYFHHPTPMPSWFLFCWKHAENFNFHKNVKYILSICDLCCYASLTDHNLAVYEKPFGYLLESII